MKRRTRIAIGAAVAVLVACAALALWQWWPDSQALVGAAARGDVAGVERCLRFGVDPNTPARWGWNRGNEGQTPLTAAAQFGRVEVMRLLLGGGADPDLRDFGPESPQQTPLSTAALHGQLEACRVLLDVGADPNLATSPGQPGEAADWTALDWALQAGHTAVADLLRQHGGVERRPRERGRG